METPVPSRPRPRTRLAWSGLEGSRRYYLTANNRNLRFLLHRRIHWMNDFIHPQSTGAELGAGIGFSSGFIQARRFVLTDITPYPWIHLAADALSTPFRTGSLDFVVANNMIHHVASPLRFFEEVRRILKPGGHLLIQEMNASLAMRLLLRLLRHESYSFDPDVFDPEVICTDPKKPWSANCAIPNLLFDDPERFRQHVPYFEIRRSSFSEFFIWLNSGGVNAKAPYVPLPGPALKALAALDSALIRLTPQTFALQRQIALRKSA